MIIEEKYLIYFVIAGGVLNLLAAIWCIARAFSKGIGWGLLALIPPFYLLWAFRGPPRSEKGDFREKGVAAPASSRNRPAGQRQYGPAPLALTLIGLILIAGTITLNKYHAANPDLGPYEQNVAGRLHLTITGWNRNDYTVLQRKKSAVVLQMANKDVTNDTLAHVVGMNLLEELDLNDTQITDEGLALLAGLPHLKIVRLARTAITDEGFQKYLAPLPSLKEVTLTKTAVRSKTLRDWKNLDNDNRKYVGP
ncbi:MAG: hypothetical protein EBV06_04805 [Planctomycetia bacterium]|nr:hypothetical protein [Planctomycetia bacterium]